MAGVAMRPQFPNRSGTAPDLYLTPPDPADYPPAAPVTTMPVDSVRTAVKDELPGWASDADVNVDVVSGGERSVELELRMHATTLAVLNPFQLVDYARVKQIELNKDGAGIGRVIARVKDAASGDPLMTFSGDATWGQNFTWVSPMVRAYVDRQRGRAVEPERDVNAAQSDADQAKSDLESAKLPIGVP